MRTIIEDRIRSYSEPRPPIDFKELIKQELSGLSAPKIDQGDSSKQVKNTRKRSFNPIKFILSFVYHRFRFPHSIQPEESACGTTCLLMISRFYGKRFSSNRLRELAHVDSSGVSLANLAYAAEQVGYITKAVQLDYTALQSVTLPCIVHWKKYHYIVVYRVTKRSVWVADPASGLRKFNRKDFLNGWDGISLILQPAEDFEKQPETSAAFWNFTRFIMPYKGIFTEIFLASLILNILALAAPIFTQVVIDRIVGHSNMSMLNIMFTGMVLILFFRFLINIIRGYLILHTSVKIDLRMLTAFYKHLLALPLTFFKTRKLGDFTQRFAENKTIRKFFSETALALILDSIMIVAYISLMAYYNLSMTGLVLVFLPVYIGLTAAFTPFLKKWNIEALTAESEAESSLIESIHGIDTLKAMTLESPARWKWEDKYIHSLNSEFRLSKNQIIFGATGELIGAVSAVLLLWYGAQKVMQGTISIGELMAFMTLLGNVTAPINKIVGLWNNIQQVLISMDRLGDIFAIPPEYSLKLSDSKGLVFKESRGDIVFDNVFFRYGGKEDPYILSNINLHIYPGQTIGVVGRSGSGKSTLVKLIARFYDATQGRICLDGCDVKNINLANLRENVGFVLQDSFMFDDTIRNNISLYDPNETSEKVVLAAQLADAHNFISGLPMGYETRIGESGIQLSGGQKQRIAIARVLYRNPKILIFDEATNALDVETETSIQKNMKTILEGKTAIVVAHRLSTVKYADLIIVVDNGEIVEQGKHSDLMESGGLYHYLIHQQYNL